MHDIFTYKKLSIPDCSFKISPSSIGKFFSYPSVWYKDNVLGEKSFTASTSTVLGTIVHAAAQSYAEKTTFTREMVEEYITETAKKQPLTEDAIQLDTIRNAYPDMAMTLINDYIRHNPPTEVERSLWCPILDNIYIGGTCDNRTGDTIIDYKSYSSATEPTKISFDYKIQALAYAFMFRYNGIPINRIRLVYVNRPIDTRSISDKTGKPIGKITPPRVTVLTEVITEDDWKMITDTLTLMAESIQAVRSYPELTHIIFKSMSLKENTNGS
jgi:hypothetical protein